MTKKKHIDTTSVPACSFCGRPHTEVQKLIAGPDIYICERCTEVCVVIMLKEGVPIKVPGQVTQVDLQQLGVRPRFKKLRFEIRQNHVFLAAPFSEPFSTIYVDHIKPVCTRLGLRAERADEVFGDQPIIEDIWESINSSQVIIADVTGRNPNVMYEIGMAHTVGRPVVIITQSIQDVPFDLKHYRCIVYEHTPRGCKLLEEKLEGTLRFVASSVQNHGTS
jgi:nucleoside 2-deoxyribosyltransferase